jgi:hypothetical protein
VSQVTVSYRQVFADEPTKPGPLESVTVPTTSLFRTACSQLIRKSKGVLPPSTCRVFGRLSDRFSKIETGIGSDTALFVIDFAKLPNIPKFIGLADLTVSVTLPPTVDAPFRDFGVLPFATLLSPVSSIAGPNTPKYLKRLYSASYEDNGKNYTGGAQGLLAAPALFPGGPFSYSPPDLAIANNAFKEPVPSSVAELINPPLFVPNDPTVCYDPRKNAFCFEANLGAKAWA